MKRLLLICASIIAIILVHGFAISEGPHSGLSPDQALQILKNGNNRFVAGKPDHPNQGFGQRELTAEKGQHPFATVISCSDSRVPVEILFDVGIGEVFVTRVAGNVAGINEVASIEYGVEHLGTPLMVILGHSKCGAVAAVVENAEAHGNIPSLLRLIAPAVHQVKKTNPKATGEALLNSCVKANVWKTTEDIIKASPIVANRVKEGKLKIIGAFYEIDTGRVNWMGSHPYQTQLLSAVKTQEKH